MSLAIEALRQVSETAGIEVHGVTLRDVDIKTALVIPEQDNGIEIQLRLQELTTSESNTSWFSFAVESITDERWTNHCEGRIAANHNLPTSPRKITSPVELSNLTQRVPGRRWYDAFHRVGFEYGPAFQPLSQIRTNSKFHDAAANVRVATESGTMDGESRYILHPSTVDACLQLIIISINAGLHKEMACGVVPLQMEEVNLWFPKEESSGSKGHAVAWTDELNGRYFNTHTKLATASGDMVLDVKNLRCVSYEAAVPQHTTEARQREPYMEVMWKPDISTITIAQAIQLYPDAVSETATAGKIVELLNHKSALGSVLYLGEPSYELMNTLKQQLPSTATITLGGILAEESEWFQSAEHDERLSTLLLPQQISEWRDIISEPYELLILGKDICRSYLMGDLLDIAKSFNTEEGHLLSIVEGSAKDDFAKNLVSSGFLANGLQFDLPDGTVFLSKQSSSTPYVNDIDHSKDEVSIISLDPKKSSLQDITKQLEKTSCNVHNKDISDFNITGVDKIIIDDLEGTMLSSHRSDVFDTLKAILCSSLSVVWLTSGVNQGKVIFGGMSQGFLRAIRSEQAAAQITLLDVDFEETPEAIGEALRSKLKNVETKNSGADTEFWLHTGVTHVPRIVPNANLNSQFSVLEDFAESVLPAETALTGKIANGSLSLYQPVPEIQGLGENEVEIQVEVVELQANDFQSGNRSPKVVLGKVLRAGSSVNTTAVGRDVVTYTQDTYSPILRVTQNVCVTAAGFELVNLAATLPALCKAVNCTIRAGNVQPGEHVLVLNTPLPIVGAIAGLSRASGFKMTAVVPTRGEKNECLSRYELHSESILLADEIEKIRDAVSRPSDSGPGLVLANDFSPLSHEIWRFMPAMGRFILSNGVFDERPDPLPFTRGVSMIPTGIDTLYKQNPASTSGLLKSALELLRDHTGLLIKNPVVHDISALRDIKDILKSSEHLDNCVVTYNYGESSIKVNTHSSNTNP